MREPDRYDHTLVNQGCWDANSEMYKHAQGDYVLYDRWQEVNDELTDLQIKYKELVEALGEIYKGA